MRENKRRIKSELPPIHLTGDEMRRLTLANSNMDLFPRIANFLARELDRAIVVQDDDDLRGVVRMGSQVCYRDENTGEVRDLVLVYPPLGAALIGLSVGQAIEYQTPGYETGKLTVLRVSPQEEGIRPNARQPV